MIFGAGRPGTAAVEEFPILGELKEQGCTDYLALPLLLGGMTRNGATFASNRPGGFADADIALLTGLAPDGG